MSETVICGKFPERLQSGTFNVPCPVPFTSSVSLIQAVSASSLNLWPSEAHLRHLRWPELPQELCLGNFHFSFPSLGELQRMLGVRLWRTHLLTLLRDSFWGVFYVLRLRLHGFKMRLEICQELAAFAWLPFPDQHSPPWCLPTEIPYCKNLCLSGLGQNASHYEEYHLSHSNL